MVILFVSTALFGLWLIWIWFTKASNLEPPEISGKLPFIGHVHMGLVSHTKLYDLLKTKTQEIQEKDGVVRFYLGPQKFYAVADPEDSLTISNTCLEKHYTYNFAKPLLGDGLLTADVSTWKKNRKLLNPAFNQQVLNGYMDLFNNQAQRLTDIFATQLGKPFDHMEILTRNYLETICSAITGIDASSYESLYKQYLPSVNEGLQLLTSRAVRYWLHNEYIYKYSFLKKKIDACHKRVTVLSTSILQKKKLEMKTSTNTQQKSEVAKPFVDFLLELAPQHTSFTDKYIQEEIDTLIIGGHDITAFSVTFALSLLGSHVEVQEKAYEEICHVIGKSNEHINKDDLSKLVYIEAILKETLRLYPVIPIIGRQIDQDIKLRNCTLKSNTGCVIILHGINRHPMWGSDANEFRPERWLDKETLPDQKYYATFGLGRRSCIGKVFAMMSMKLSLVHVLRKYRISSDISKMKIKIDVMIRPESGFHISLEKRD